jgi:hypothetical protein
MASLQTIRVEPHHKRAAKANYATIGTIVGTPYRGRISPLVNDRMINDNARGPKVQSKGWYCLKSALMPKTASGCCLGAAGRLRNGLKGQ